MENHVINSHERAIAIRAESRALRASARVTVEHAKAAVDRAKRLLHEYERKAASAVAAPQPMDMDCRETRVRVA